MKMERLTSDRLFSIDIIRGVASLGILIMNVQLYSSVYAAYLNPVVTTAPTDPQYGFWIFSHIFSDQKFMTIFAILFGSDTLLFIERTKAGTPIAPLYYRRLFWLFILGMAHAYLMWSFDILVAYSLCGAWVFLLRHKSPRWLFWAGILSITMASFILAALGQLLPWLPADFSHHLQAAWYPDHAALDAETRAYRGGWLAQMPVRAMHAWDMQTLYFAVWSFWRVSGLMCWGMALYKLHFFHGETAWSKPGWALLCLFSGVALIATGIHQNEQHAWAFAYSQFAGLQFNYWGSLLVSAGYLLALMWLLGPHICGFSPRNGPLAALMAVGRAPLSNYFLQTFLCTTIFYGHGFGMFGLVDRGEQWLVIMAVWATQLVLSLCWMRRFRLGPVEWAWRSLSYGQVLPIRRADTPEIPGLR